MTNASEHTGRVLALAAALVLLFAGLAEANGVFDRLDPAERHALAIFAAAFAALTVCVDGNVRAWLRRALLRTRPAKSPGAKTAAT